MMGSIREALKAGCKLAITETKMTMTEVIKRSEGAMVGESTRSFCMPKSNLIPAEFKTKMMISPIRFPTTTPIAPRQKPSAINIDRILPERVPIAAIVPISRILSYTAIIITFIILISTTAISISLMKKVMTSIMRAMLKKGESFSQE